MDVKNKISEEIHNNRNCCGSPKFTFFVEK